MPMLSDLSTQEAMDKALYSSFKILLVGPQGSGKSITASDFWRLGYIHFLDFDGRLKPVINYHKDNPEALAKISYETYSSANFKQFMKDFENFQDAPGPVYKGRKISTLVLDSVTSCSNSSIVHQLIAKDKMKTTKGGLPATSWDEINGETVWFTEMLEMADNMNKLYGTNIIWIAHPVSKTEITDSGSHKYESIAAYGNKIPSIIPTKFDEIYYLKVKKLSPTESRRIGVTSLISGDDVIAKTAMDIETEINVGAGLYTAIMDSLARQKQNEKK